MKNLTTILVSILTVGALASCGDDNKAIDAAVPIDSPDIDALVFPPAPTLGTQIDRMGRPAVNTALNGAIADDPLKTAKKDAYNHATDFATWGATVLDAAATPPRTVVGEFSVNQGLFDSLDQGSGLTGSTTGPGGGCGNAALYNNPVGSGYAVLATVLADDQLYVDTTKLTCNFYLSLEVEVATGATVAHTQCGGRTLTLDVVDTSYSLLAAGLNGFMGTSFTPAVGDGVAAHTDVNNDTFPFLGAPH